MSTRFNNKDELNQEHLTLHIVKFSAHTFQSCSFKNHIKKLTVKFGKLMQKFLEIFAKNVHWWRKLKRDLRSCLGQISHAEKI